MTVHIYFVHDTLTPGNVRATWQDAPQCPAVGEKVRGEYGVDGAMVVWTVAAVEWIGGVEGRSVTCYVTGPEPDDRPEKRDCGWYGCEGCESCEGP